MNKASRAKYIDSSQSLRTGKSVVASVLLTAGGSGGTLTLYDTSETAVGDLSDSDILMVIKAVADESFALTIDTIFVNGVFAKIEGADSVASINIR